MKVIKDGQEYDKDFKGHKRQEGHQGRQGHQVAKAMKVMSMSNETDRCNVIFAALFYHLGYYVQRARLIN